MTITLPQPQPKQVEFIKCKTRYVAFGGARGGGKSFAVRLKAKLLGLKYSGIKILIVRRTYSELMENHIKPLLIDTADYGKYRDSDKTITLVNGSVIKFGYCATEVDVNQYQGQEYDIIFLDEATQLTEYQYTCITACCRGANDYPKQINLTCNPGGVGHAWVKRLFIDKQYRNGEKPEDYSFIRSSVYDNKILLEKDPEYLQTLQNLPNDLKLAWLDGRWDVFAGQFFGEWAYEKNTISPFEIPKHWNRVIALDYGFDMLAVLWGAFDEHGNGYIYKEFNQSNLTASEGAKAIIEHTTEEERAYGRVRVYAPPDLWSRSKDTGKCIAELFSENGVDFVRADNNRQNGWSNVKDWIHYDQDDEEDMPKLRIFSTCSELIKNIPLLQFAKNNSLDCATEPHDITHNTDALRYLCQSRPRKTKVKQKKDYGTASWLQSEKERRLNNKRNGFKTYRI